MKFSSLYSIFFLGIASVHGQARLSLEELFTKQSLQPENIRGIQWIPETEQWCIPDQGSSSYLLRYSLKSDMADTILYSRQLNPEMKALPPFEWLNSKEIYYTHKEQVFRYNIQTGENKAVSRMGKDWQHTDMETNRFSVAYTLENNLFVYYKGEEIQVSFDQNPQIVSGRSVHREEFGISKGTFWSPKGTLLAFYRMDQTMVTDYPLVELGSFPAVEHTIKYPMAGQKSHHVQLGIFNPQSRKTLFVQTGEPAEQYLTNVSWTPDEKYILIALVNRAQNEMKLNMYDAMDGKFIRTLFTETDPEWVEPLNPASFVGESSGEFVWQSERSGSNQLYLYNLDGKLIKQLSSGAFTVTRYIGSSKDGRQFYAEIADRNGLDRKLLQTDRNGKMRIVTKENGVHTVSLSDSKKFIIDHFSSLENPRRISILNEKGIMQRQLLQASDPLSGYDLPKPEIISLNASDGTALNGRLFKPANMEQGKRYPVILYVYGGPHAQMVSNRWLGGANLWLSWMASKGYVVFTLDNRGSGDRGQAFEQVIHRRLGQIEMEDQIRGIRYLNSLPYVDSTRIGVHGWSYGGFMTSNLMCTYPDYFKVGVGGGPVMDWRMYEVMYTERYMDTPQENPEGYERSSLLNKATQLNNRLMLIHGTLDDVVVWQHSQEFVKRCVDAGVLLDYMIYPGHGHNVRGKDRLHLMKTITRYLEENL